MGIRDSFATDSLIWGKRFENAQRFCSSLDLLLGSDLPPEEPGCLRGVRFRLKEAQSHWDRLFKNPTPEFEAQSDYEQLRSKAEAAIQVERRELADLEHNYSEIVYEAMQRVSDSLDSLTFFHLIPLVGGEWSRNSIGKGIGYVQAAIQRDPSHAEFYQQLFERSKKRIVQLGESILEEITTDMREKRFKTLKEYEDKVGFLYGWVINQLGREEDKPLMMSAKYAAINTEIEEIMAEPLSANMYKTITKNEAFFNRETITYHKPLIRIQQLLAHLPQEQRDTLTAKITAYTERVSTFYEEMPTKGIQPKPRLCTDTL